MNFFLLMVLKKLLIPGDDVDTVDVEPAEEKSSLPTVQKIRV
jgi:hypothetical protein